MFNIFIKNHNLLYHFGIFLISGVFHGNMIAFFLIYFQRNWGILFTVKNCCNIKNHVKYDLAGKGLTIFIESTKDLRLIPQLFKNLFFKTNVGSCFRYIDITKL